MSKPITEIHMNEDGTISFDFMKDPVSVSPIRNADQAVPVAYYDLTGRQLPSSKLKAQSPKSEGIYIVRYSDGTIRKHK